MVDRIIKLTVAMVLSLFAVSASAQGQVGSPCTTDANCEAGSVCTPESDENGATGFVGGYCMKFDCTFEQTMCGEGGTCVIDNSMNVSMCLASCRIDTDCRAGYRCQGGTVCLPGNRS